jgi:uncharacterized protein
MRHRAEEASAVPRGDPARGRASLTRETVTASLRSVRRLAVTKQHLAGKLPSRVTANAILSVVRDLGYVQWDPVAVVAPSHLLSLWSRLGDFRPSQLDRLLWKEKKLFQHWTPIASIVLTEDYPIYYSLMRRYPESLSRSWGNQRTWAKRFLTKHSGLRKKVLDALRSGPLVVGEFEDHARSKRDAGDWSSSSDVTVMLYHLLMGGEVMVVGHRGNQNLWGLSEQFLPGWADRTELPEEELERRTAERAIRALGVATPREVNLHFVRGRYQDLRGTLARLEADGRIHRVTVAGLPLRDEHYIHDQDLSTLASMEGSAWQPRMTLLPPFDNMLINSARASSLFDFDYVREQFLPAAKRRFGTYVLPILSGERFIGRIDPRLDRAKGELRIHAVHAEAEAPRDRRTGAEIGETIDRLAQFVGADRVTYSSKVPTEWKGSLH